MTIKVIKEVDSTYQDVDRCFTNFDEKLQHHLLQGWKLRGEVHLSEGRYRPTVWYATVEKEIKI